METQPLGIPQITYRAASQQPTSCNLQWLNVPPAFATTGHESVRTERAMEMVTTAIVSSTPTQHSDQPLSIPACYSCVRFRMPCSSPQVHLFIGDDDSRSIALHQMMKDQDQWDVVLRLKAGRYRYRYYAENEVTTTLPPPDKVDDLPIRTDDFASFNFSNISAGNEIGGEVPSNGSQRA